MGTPSSVPGDRDVSDDPAEYIVGPDLAALDEAEAHPCVCSGDVCCGEGYEDEPGTCVACAALDGEEHCPRCTYDCCPPLASLEDPS